MRQMSLARLGIAAVLIAGFFTSCCSVGKTPAPTALAIAGIDSKEPLGGPSLAASALGCLQERLVACGRFKVLERLQLDLIVGEQPHPDYCKAGKLVAADW